MLQRQKRPFLCAQWIAIGLIGVVASMLLAIYPLLSQAISTPIVPSFSEIKQIDPDAKPLGQAIRVGLRIKNIYDLKLSSQSFMADGWYQLSWGDEVQTILDKFQIEPSRIVEFTNEIDLGNSFSQTLVDPFPVAPGLTHSYYVKFSKKFFIDKISQKYAPFDRQELPINIEIMPSPLSGSQSTSLIELLPPPIKQFPIAGEFASMIGFRLTGTSWTRQIVYYGGVRNKSPYSRATAIFTFSPQLLTVFLKWILPMIIVMTIVVLVPSIDAILSDSRMAIAPAALLTLVILHDNYRSGFPPSPYLSFLDKIYAYNYLVCLAIFLVTLAGSNTLCRLKGKDKDTWVVYANNWDRGVQISIIMGYLIVSVISWYD